METFQWQLSMFVNQTAHPSVTFISMNG